MKISPKRRILLSLAAIMLFSTAAIANAEILYDGADTSGVTTDNQFIIDYDQDSGGNIDLQFGNSTRYLRWNGTNFAISNNLDLQSNQLLNARVQNVTVLADVPSCAAAGDRGKKIFVGASNITNVNGAQTLNANKEYICNDTNAAANRWVATTGGDADTLDTIDSSQFLRSDTSDNYTAGTLQFDAGTTVTFTPTTTVNLPNTTANTFTVNNDAANGDSSVLSFGDGSGSLTWNDTTGVFTANNSLTVNGTATANSLVVNSGGTINLNNNQVQNLRLENVATLPACAAGTTGRHLYLTTLDGTNPPGDYVCDGTTWRKSSIDNTNATLEFQPEFKDGVVRPDTTNNVGTMSIDYDATNTRNFYRWLTTNTSTFQDIDVVVDVRLPNDFKSFQTTNPIQLDLRTNTIAAADQFLDVTGTDTGGTALTLVGASTLVSGTAYTWTTKNISITGGTFTAGSRMQLTFKASSKRTLATARPVDIGTLRLNYVRKSP